MKTFLMTFIVFISSFCNASDQDRRDTIEILTKNELRELAKKQQEKINKQRAHIERLNAHLNSITDENVRLGLIATNRMHPLSTTIMPLNGKPLL